MKVGGTDAKPAQKFIVHKAIICQKSTFFRVALAGNFKEAAQQEVELPTDDAAIFDTFVEWLYTSEISVRPDPEGQRIWQWFVELYILGDKLDAKDFKNHVMNSMAQALMTAVFNDKGLPSQHIVTDAYSGTPKNSQLRQLLVDLYSLYHAIDLPRDQLPTDFIVDVAIAMKMHISTIVSNGWRRHLLSLLGKGNHYHERENIEY